MNLFDPGVYSFEPGETILDVIIGQEVLLKKAYEEGAVFIRESVAISQKESFERSADELERYYSQYHHFRNSKSRWRSYYCTSFQIN